MFLAMTTIKVKLEFLVKDDYPPRQCFRVEAPGSNNPSKKRLASVVIGVFLLKMERASKMPLLSLRAGWRCSVQA